MCNAAYRCPARLLPLGERKVWGAIRRTAQTHTACCVLPFVGTRINVMFYHYYSFQVVN